MEDQKISLETARLAKEKGFNEKCTFFYVIGFKTIKEELPLKTWGNYENNEKLLQAVSLAKGQPHLALAPTQSLLQKWLRENHKIHIVIKPYQNEFLDFTIAVYTEHSNAIGGFEEDGSYISYEDALEDALQKALSLI